MGFFNNQFPYTNFHDLNLDWILAQIRKLDQDFADFAAANEVIYANPFDWDITRQYSSNTIVRDPNTSDLYISHTEVPRGVQLTDTTYWYPLGNAAGTANNVKMIKTDPEIALIGDSSFYHIDDNTIFTRYFENAHVSNYSSNGAKWEDIPGQLLNIQTRPDIIYIWCGGNDVLAGSVDWGAHMGAPDIHDHTVSNNPSTVFEYIKYSLQYIRDTYPLAEVFNLVRPINMNKLQNRWYYYWYYQTMIMQEWCVPVIQMNDVANFTMWNSTQIGLLTENDQYHWNADLRERAFGRVANSYHAGAPTALGYNLPQTFWVPESVLDLSSTSTSIKNHIRKINWVLRHCLDPQSAGLNGVVWAGKIGGSATCYSPTFSSYSFVKFEAITDFQHNKSVVTMFFSGYSMKYDYDYTNDTWENLGAVISEYDITSSNNTAWYNLHAGTYIVRVSGQSTLSLPADISLSNSRNSILEVRHSYNTDAEITYSYALLYDTGGTNATHMYKGAYQFSDSSESWYKVDFTAV